MPVEDDDPAGRDGDDEEGASVQLAATALSVNADAVKAGYYAPGARYDWEPGGMIPGRRE